MMFKKLCTTKLEFKEVPLLTMWIIPIAFASSILGGAGHAPVLLYIPYTLVLGPLAVVGFLLGPRLSGGIESIFFVMAGPYLLYLLYGYVFAYLSARSSAWCRIYIGAILVMHLLSGVIFLYLGEILGAGLFS